MGEKQWWAHLMHLQDRQMKSDLVVFSYLVSDISSKLWNTTGTLMPECLRSTLFRAARWVKGQKLNSSGEMLRHAVWKFITLQVKTAHGDWVRSMETASHQLSPNAFPRRPARWFDRFTQGLRYRDRPASFGSIQTKQQFKQNSFASTNCVFSKAVHKKYLYCVFLDPRLWTFLQPPGGPLTGSESWEVTGGKWIGVRMTSSRKSVRKLTIGNCVPNWNIFNVLHVSQ